MSDELEKINEIFRSHDEQAGADSPSNESAADTGRGKTPFKAVDKLMIDSTGNETRNYTGDAESERDYRPVRQSHESRSGCLGGAEQHLPV